MKLVFSAALLLLISRGFAQEVKASSPDGLIMGRVADSASSQPIDYATVTVYAMGNERPVTGVTTNTKGNFQIEGLAPGNYRVVVEFIGYRSKEKANIQISEKQRRASLGTFYLSTQASTLAGVTITAQKGLLENKIDKMVYNAEKDITSQGGVATDLLKKIPMVSVDMDGNVELQGNGNIRFLINGKPSSIFGNNLADALQSIPASQIKSIEVITSPGAKYDAEGTGGIINIILKDSKIQGINGTINSSGGTRLENASFNLNARKNKIGANMFFSGNAQLPSTTLNSSNRPSFDSSGKLNDMLLQNGQSRFLRNGFESGVSFFWNINKRNDLQAEIGYDNFGNSTSGYLDQQQTLYDSLQAISANQLSVTNSNNRFRGQSVDMSLSYKKTFAKEGQELDVLYQSSLGHNKSYFEQEQDSLSNKEVFSGLNSNNTGRDHETSVQADYTHPFSENVKMEAGGKLDLRNITSNTTANDLNTEKGQYQPDTVQSNAMTYNRHVYAGYASLTFPLGEFLNVKSGLRYERTVTDAVFSQASGISIPSYSTWAPSVILSHLFDNDQTIKISYTHRIQRPGYRSLNPFVNASDPKNITQGNPLLKPELGDNYELAYIKSFEKGSSINVVLFYRRSAQDIQPYIVYYPTYEVGDSVYTNVSVNTPQNIGVENNYGLNIYGSVPFTSRLTVRTNLSFFDRFIQNGIVAGANITSFNYRVNMNITYQFKHDFVGEAFGNFNSPRNEVQGRFPSFTSYNLAFRKQLWKKKGSIGFTTTNPFNKYVVQTTAVSGTGFILNSTRKLPFRSFGISFMYKFGKLEFKKDDQDHNRPQGGQDQEN
ncbi:MAG TPA: TonB-dependent receptor [Puia sp.]|nr:TonB-dependent receptor [Puia sp.]